MTEFRDENHREALEAAWGTSSSQAHTDTDNPKAEMGTGKLVAAYEVGTPQVELTASYTASLAEEENRTPGSS